MSDFRCPRYWWDGSQWRCQNLPNDYLSSYDFDTYCTNKNRCLECPYMDSEVREKVAAYKKEVDERVEEHVEEQRREYEAEQRNKENDYSYRENNNTSSTTTCSSSGSSDTGCLSALFSLIAVAIIKVLPYLWWVSMTALVPLIMMISPVTYVLAIISILCHIAFHPYWITLLLYRIKKQISTKMMFAYLGKWFKKGPFAYMDIKAIKNNLISK